MTVLSWEIRQPAEPHEMWQDSAVLAWADLARGVGGYHRIGVQPGHPDGPAAHLSHGFFAADRIYKRNVTLPLSAEDLASPDWPAGGGTCRYSYSDHGGVWTFDEEDVSGELRLHDFHPAVDIYPKSGQVGQRIASGHLEAGCRVTGQVRIGDTEFHVDGMGIRDRGWGLRFWEEILVHRSAVATFGPHETVYAVSILGSHGTVHDFGALVRGAELVPATEVDVVTFLERDGLTHRGGTVRMVLATGEVIELRAEPLQKGIISFMAGRSAINDTICRFAWGDRIGVGDFEISNNAAAGASEPVFAINGVLADGLHLPGAQP